jgi:peptidoglycan/xylan/chitin deacetylase (PgdA/CDA1 family)
MEWTVESLRRIRTMVIRACRATGVVAIVRDSHWRQQRLLVIGYHGISIEDEHLWAPNMFLSQARFESRLELIRSGGYRVLPLEQALVLLREGALPKRSVALTFDDGYYNFYRQAYPALRARGFPATVYLTTYYCEFNRPIYNLGVSYALWKARPQRWRPVNLMGFGGDFDLPTMQWPAWEALIGHADQQGLSGAEKDRLVDAVAESLGVDYGPIREKRLLQLMNPAEVTELAREGVDFQMHTHRHRRCRDASFLNRDLTDNAIRLERYTGLRPLHFCYPNGEYHQIFRDCLRRQGVRTATTCDPGLAARNTPWLCLPRLIDTTSVSDLAFEGWLSGIQAWVTKKRRYAPAA